MGHWTAHAFHMCLSHCIVHRLSYKEGVLYALYQHILMFFIYVNVDLTMSNVIMMFHIYISTCASLKDLFWVRVWAAVHICRFFLPRDTFSDVVLWSSLCLVLSSIPEGTVCVLRVGGFFFLVKLHILTTAHSNSSVSEEFLSILLCAYCACSTQLPE